MWICKSSSLPPLQVAVSMQIANSSDLTDLNEIGYKLFQN